MLELDTWQPAPPYMEASYSYVSDSKVGVLFWGWLDKGPAVPLALLLTLHAPLRNFHHLSNRKPHPTTTKPNQQAYRVVCPDCGSNSQLLMAHSEFNTWVDAHAASSSTCGTLVACRDACADSYGPDALRAAAEPLPRRLMALLALHLAQALARDPEMVQYHSWARAALSKHADLIVVYQALITAWQTGELRLPRPLGAPHAAAPGGRAADGAGGRGGRGGGRSGRGRGGRRSKGRGAAWCRDTDITSSSTEEADCGEEADSGALPEDCTRKRPPGRPQGRGNKRQLVDRDFDPDDDASKSFVRSSSSDLVRRASTRRRVKPRRMSPYYIGTLSDADADADADDRMSSEGESEEPAYGHAGAANAGPVLTDWGMPLLHRSSSGAGSSGGRTPARRSPDSPRQQLQTEGAPRQAAAKAPSLNEGPLPADFCAILAALSKQLQAPNPPSYATTLAAALPVMLQQYPNPKQRKRVLDAVLKWLRTERGEQAAEEKPAESAAVAGSLCARQPAGGGKTQQRPFSSDLLIGDGAGQRSAFAEDERERWRWEAALGTARQPQNAGASAAAACGAGAGAGAGGGAAGAAAGAGSPNSSDNPCTLPAERQPGAAAQFCKPPGLVRSPDCANAALLPPSSGEPSSATGAALASPQQVELLAMQQAWPAGGSSGGTRNAVYAPTGSGKTPVAEAAASQQEQPATAGVQQHQPQSPAGNLDPTVRPIQISEAEWREVQELASRMAGDGPQLTPDMLAVLLQTAGVQPPLESVNRAAEQRPQSAATQPQPQQQQQHWFSGPELRPPLCPQRPPPPGYLSATDLQPVTCSQGTIVPPLYDLMADDLFAAYDGLWSEGALACGGGLMPGASVMSPAAIGAQEQQQQQLLQVQQVQQLQQRRGPLDDERIDDEDDVSSDMDAEGTTAAVAAAAVAASQEPVPVRVTQLHAQVIAQLRTAFGAALVTPNACEAPLLWAALMVLASEQLAARSLTGLQVVDWIQDAIVSAGADANVAIESLARDLTSQLPHSSAAGSKRRGCKVVARLQAVWSAAIQRRTVLIESGGWAAAEEPVLVAMKLCDQLLQFELRSHALCSAGTPRPSASPALAAARLELSASVLSLARRLAAPAPAGVNAHAFTEWTYAAAAAVRQQLLGSGPTGIAGLADVDESNAAVRLSEAAQTATAHVRVLKSAARCAA